MGSRTYLPTLVATVRLLCIYIARNQVTIRANLPVEAIPVFDQLEAACSAFNAFAGVIDPIHP